ncbi:MAG TPA: hypothetical protein VLA39_03930 [Marinobacterium sp.]|nr:hypothetical protein [Marinobacterium sp.]
MSITQRYREVLERVSGYLQTGVAIRLTVIITRRDCIRWVFLSIGRYHKQIRMVRVVKGKRPPSTPCPKLNARG